MLYIFLMSGSKEGGISAYHISKTNKTLAVGTSAALVNFGAQRVPFRDMGITFDQNVRWYGEDVLGAFWTHQLLLFILLYAFGVKRGPRLGLIATASLGILGAGYGYESWQAELNDSEFDSTDMKFYGVGVGASVLAALGTDIHSRRHLRGS